MLNLFKGLAGFKAQIYYEKAIFGGPDQSIQQVTIFSFCTKINATGEFIAHIDQGQSSDEDGLDEEPEPEVKTNGKPETKIEEPDVADAAQSEVQAEANPETEAEPEVTAEPEATAEEEGAAEPEQVAEAGNEEKVEEQKVAEE